MRNTARWRSRAAACRFARAAPHKSKCVLHPAAWPKKPKQFPLCSIPKCHAPLVHLPPQVRDGAETSLEREISEIEQSISKLSIQLSRLNTDISHMDVTKLRLENDLKDKREALDLEAEVEHRQRELGLRINAAFEN